jgi:cation diffusion facilitator CzcD-associated flavoprotein CzcO
MARRLIVLGAGPIGIETALGAAEAGFEVRVLEAGKVGAHLLAWGHIRMFSPWEMNCSSLGLGHLRRAGRAPFRDPKSCPTGGELARRYLQPLARCAALRGRVVTGCRVLGVSRDRLLKGDRIGRPNRADHPFRILAQRGAREVVFESDLLVDATGTFGQPRHLGNGGLPAPGERRAAAHIDYRPVDFAARRREFAGRRLLLIGSGHTAATAAVALRDLVRTDARTRVFWALRAERAPFFARVAHDPLPARDRLQSEGEAIAGGQVAGMEPLPGTFVEAIAGAAPRSVTGRGSVVARGRPLRVTLSHGDRRASVVVDRILAHTGFQPDRSLYSELQVHECYASGGPMKLAAALLGAASADCMTQPAPAADLLSNPEPGFFILGSKSYGRGSAFLLRTGLRQIETLLAALGPAGRVA